MLVALAPLAFTGCEKNNDSELETRIIKLEEQANKQDKKIKLLTSAVTRSSASVFDPPLKQFFDAPEFWEIVYEDKGVCHNNCYQQYKQELKACNGDKQCENEAAIKTVACHKKCGSPF